MSVFIITPEKYYELINEARNPKSSLATRKITMKQAIIVKLRLENHISYNEYQIRWEMLMLESLAILGKDTCPEVKRVNAERSHSKRKHELLTKLTLKHKEKYGMTELYSDNLKPLI